MYYESGKCVANNVSARKANKITLGKEKPSTSGCLLLFSIVGDKNVEKINIYVNSEYICYAMSFSIDLLLTGITWL